MFVPRLSSLPAARARLICVKGASPFVGSYALEGSGRMSTRILVINGHGDIRPERFCSGLANAYAEAATDAGHEVRRIDVGALSFPLLVRFEHFQLSPDNSDIKKAQQDIQRAEHLVFVHPLWLGAAPGHAQGVPGVCRLRRRGAYAAH